MVSRVLVENSTVAKALNVKITFTESPVECSAIEERAEENIAIEEVT